MSDQLLLLISACFLSF